MRKLITTAIISAVVSVGCVCLLKIAEPKITAIINKAKDKFDSDVDYIDYDIDD